MTARTRTREEAWQERTGGQARTRRYGPPPGFSCGRDGRFEGRAGGHRVRIPPAGPDGATATDSASPARPRELRGSMTQRTWKFGVDPGAGSRPYPSPCASSSPAAPATSGRSRSSGSSRPATRSRSWTISRPGTRVLPVGRSLGSFGDSAVGDLLGGDRGRPPLRREVPRRRVDRGPAASTTGPTWPEASPCSTRCGAGVERIVFSSSAAVYGVPTRRRSPRTPCSARSTRTVRSKRTFESAMQWYGRPTDSAASASATSTRPARPRRNGEGHDPETHLIPNALAALEGGRGPDPVRRRLPDAGRHAGPGLHPRPGSRRRPPRRARSDRARRTRARTWRSSAISGAAAGSASARCSRRPSRSSGSPKPQRSGHGARVIPRCSWPPSSARRRCSTGGRCDRRSSR